MTKEELRAKIEDLKVIEEQIEAMEANQLYYCVTNPETGELTPPTTADDEYIFGRYRAIQRIIDRMLDMAAKI